MDNHKEGTIKHILLLPSLNLPWDDLEEEVRGFLSLRTAGFWAQYQALIDQNDPTTFHIPQDERQEMLDKLRFTTLQLEDSTLRKKDPKEIDDTVQAFLNYAPTGLPSTSRNRRSRSLNSLGPWTLMSSGKSARMRRRGAGTPQSLTSLVPPINARVGNCYR